MLVADKRREKSIPKPVTIVRKMLPSKLLRMLQAQVYEKRVGFRDFFHDFDHLRKGIISEGKLRCVLSLLTFEVTEEEISAIAEIYGTGDNSLDYRRLCSDVESALICPRLEDNPSGGPPPPFDLFAAKEGKKASLDEKQSQNLCEIETIIRRRVVQRGIYLVPHFRAYDKYNRLVITGNQFSRAMATLGFELGEDELDLLMQKYCIGGSASRFAYRDFCFSIDSSKSN